MWFRNSICFQFILVNNTHNPNLLYYLCSWRRKNWRNAYGEETNWDERMCFMLLILNIMDWSWSVQRPSIQFTKSYLDFDRLFHNNDRILNWHFPFLVFIQINPVAWHGMAWPGVLTWCHCMYHTRIWVRYTQTFILLFRQIQKQAHKKSLQFINFTDII